jgi:hypothetical protein
MPHARLSSYEGIVPKTTDWRRLGEGKPNVIPAEGRVA